MSLIDWFHGIITVIKGIKQWKYFNKINENEIKLIEIECTERTEGVDSRIDRIWLNESESNWRQS